MSLQKLEIKMKRVWNWIWNSDSFLSWIVALLIIFVLVKFIFFPVLSLIMGTSLPLAGVESSSMDHQIVGGNQASLNLCGKSYSKENKEPIDFNNYWDTCGSWYENKNINKETFSRFSLKNGFAKGDIIIVWGRFTPKIGDVIIFKPNSESQAPRPIIHRIVSINENKIIQTKGDHNQDQLTPSNNVYKTDETNINPEQVIGKAIIKIPYLGWVKIGFTGIINLFFR